ncbi:hypothetical protein D3C81_2294420 [compost metagenome]
MQPFAIVLALIGAPIGCQNVIGMVPGEDHLLRNLAVLGPALRGVYLLVLLGEGG